MRRLKMLARDETAGATLDRCVRAGWQHEVAS